MSDWPIDDPPPSSSRLLDRAVRLHVAARGMKTRALRQRDVGALDLAQRMHARAEALAELELDDECQGRRNSPHVLYPTRRQRLEQAVIAALAVAIATAIAVFAG